jgi:ribosome-associated protein YbcJ (S4-like RNA binding protein)
MHMTPRRSAQLGLGAACLILVSSVAVLVAGAADSRKDKEVQSSQTVSTPAVSASTLTQTIAVASKH